MVKLHCTMNGNKKKLLQDMCPERGGSRAGKFSLSLLLGYPTYKAPLSLSLPNLSKQHESGASNLSCIAELQNTGHVYFRMTNKE